MSDQLTTTSEVDASIGELVNAEMQEVLTATAIMPPLVTDVSALSEPGIDTIKFPKMGNFQVVKKLPGVPVDAQVNAVSTDDLALDQHGVVQFLLEDVAKLQSKVNFSQSYIQQAAKDLAVEMDQFIIDALEAGASASAPDHRVAYAGSDIADADIVGARKLLNTQKVPLADRSLVVNEDSESAILLISNFVKANEVGSDEVVREGRIGRLRGFNVWMTPLGERLKSLAFHKSALVFGRQLQPRYQTESSLKDLGERHSLDHLYGVKVMDSGKRVVMLGTAS